MIEFNRESRARLHIAMLGAFENPTDAEKAYVEICSHSAFPADVFNLARAIEFNIYKKMFATDFQFTSVDASALEGEFESEAVSWAMRLCGFCARQRGAKTIWTDAPSNEQTLSLILPASLLDDWNL